MKAKLKSPRVLLVVLVLLVVCGAILGNLMGKQSGTAVGSKAQDARGVLGGSVAFVEVSVDRNLKVSQQDIRIATGGTVRWANHTGTDIEIVILAHDYGEAFNGSLIIADKAQGHYQFHDSGTFAYYLKLAGDRKGAKTLGYMITVE